VELKSIDEMKTYTTEQIAEYFQGWKTADAADDYYSYSAMNNALAMLDDYQDGIEAYFERKEETNAEGNP
jgi:hypothetical protein